MLDMKKVGKNIKNARTEKNMTQLELADILGVSYQAVSNWERGNTMPDIAKIPDISKVLGIEISKLLGDDNCGDTVKKVLEENPEPLSANELTEVAAILPPKEFKKELERTNENETLNIKAIVGLAPFLDDETLDDFVSKVDVANIKDIVPLAPFLSDETLTELAKRISSANMDDLVALAPFMPDEALNDIVEGMDTDDFKGITAIAPFLSEETLDQIADRAIENNKVSELSSLACFLGNGTLKKIANHLVYSGDRKSLSEFAIFL